MRLERLYVAEAAHQLSAGVPDGHPCKRLHGHRYEIKVIIFGDVNPSTGMLLEYEEIDRRVGEVLGLVDHRFINMLGFEVRVGTDPTTPFPVLIGSEIEGSEIKEPGLAAFVRENSTVEHLKAWFLAELKHRFPRTKLEVGKLSFLEAQVYDVEIKEDPRSSVT